MFAAESTFYQLTLSTPNATRFVQGKKTKEVTPSLPASLPASLTHSIIHSTNSSVHQACQSSVECTFLVEVAPRQLQSEVITSHLPRGNERLTATFPEEQSC